MNYNELKKITKGWTVHDLYNQIYKNIEEQMGDQTSQYIEENFAFLNEFKISNEYGALFNGDKFMFVDGHIEYLYSLYFMLPKQDFLFARDARFNFYQAHFSQIFNGLNHFLSLLMMKEHIKNDIYFWKNIEYAIKKDIKKNNDNKQIYIEFLITIIQSITFKILWLIRNSLTHKYVMPIEEIDMSFLLRSAISYSTTIFLYFKLIRDDEYIKNEEYLKLLRDATDRIKKFDKDWEKTMSFV